MNDSEQPGTQTAGGGAGKGITGSDRGSRRRGRPRPYWRLVRWTFALGFCLFVALAGALFGQLWRNKAARDVFNGVRIADILHGDPLASYTPEAYFKEHPHTLNVLILGCDRDYVGKRINGVAVPVPLMNTNGRSDAILVARYDFDRGTISVITIPRDTAVHVPGRGMHKINAAHQFGGPTLTQATIKEEFGIDTDAYVTLHFEAFEKIVDAVGGVDLNVKKQLDYDDNWALLHIHLKPGFQHLGGYQAMGYVRIRHSDSDLMRAERQHEFVEALRQQVKNPAILLKIPEVLNSITENLHTDLSTGQLLTLANWAKGLPQKSIVLTTMPSVEGPVYVTVNRKPARKMIADIFFGGNEDAVNITAPDRTTMYAMSHRPLRRRRMPVRDAPPTDNGSDVPLSDSPPAEPDSAPATGDGADKPSGAASTDVPPPATDKKDGGTADKSKDPPSPKNPISALADAALVSLS